MEYQKLVDELAEKCLLGQVTFLVGAGIDIRRTSNVPGWDDIRFEMLQILGQEDTIENVGYVENYKGHFLNEVLLQLVSENLFSETGIDQATEVVKRCVDTTNHSWIHRFLAWSIKVFGNGVLTTNYNYLIEHAAEAEELGDAQAPFPKENLIRLHGELNDPASMRHKVDSVYAPLDGEIISSAAPLLEKELLLVLGYRGADEFDVIPMIFGDDTEVEIIWTVHPTTEGIEPDELVASRLSRPVTVVDADTLLLDVYSKIKSIGGQHDALLDRGLPAAANGDEGWWKAGLASWGKDMWSTNTDAMRFLWAKIADHVRAPFVSEAYQRFLSASDDEYRNLFAEAHSAYDRRIKGSFDQESFQSILRRLKEAVTNSPGGQTTASRVDFEILHAWTLHEFGVGLQNANRFYEAKLVLEEAVRQRTILGDDSASYSIFQVFMNGIQAAKAGFALDNFAPAGWREWLPKELMRSEAVFRAANSTEHHPNTVHNRAFLNQAMAEEHESNGEIAKAGEKYAIASKLNLEAFNVRSRLRDPRRTAQSQVRIAQCALGLARIAFANNDRSSANAWIEEAKDRIGQTVEIYDTVPQEDIRTQEVEDVLIEIARLESGH